MASWEGGGHRSQRYRMKIGINRQFLYEVFKPVFQWMFQVLIKGGTVDDVDG